MRISQACSILFAVSSIACGEVVERHYIDETTVSTQPSSPQMFEGPFHSRSGWQSHIPFYVEGRAPSEVVEASLAAADIWNDAVGYPLFQFQGTIDSDRGGHLFGSLDDDLTVIYYEKNWVETTGKTAATLATAIWESEPYSDSIVRGDVILNAEIYLFQDSTKEARDESRRHYIVDAETVLIHELGHLLGLDHVDSYLDPESVMHARTFIGPYLYTRSLSDEDLANIRSIYN